MKAHVRIELRPDKTTFAKWRTGGTDATRSVEAWSEEVAKLLLSLNTGPVDSVDVIVRSENGHMFTLAEYEQDANG